MLINIGRSILTTLVNGVAANLPDDAISSRLRPYLYRLLNVRAGAGTAMKGGIRVNGRGLTLGERVFVNRDAFFDLTGPVTIGNDVVVGHHATFVTAHHAVGPDSRRAGQARPGAITVGDGAWIGCRAIILPDVHIGAGSIVGAGAVVTRDVPANSIVAGSPAAVIRDMPRGPEGERHLVDATDDRGDMDLQPYP